MTFWDPHICPAAAGGSDGPTADSMVAAKSRQDWQLRVDLVCRNDEVSAKID
jgi:hypothetical protein